MLEAIYHSRKSFYYGRDIYWYHLLDSGQSITTDTSKVPKGFLRVPDTKYFEFGGSIEEAIKSLFLNKFDVIMEGVEI